MEHDCWEFDFVRMRYHKEEQLDVGTEACYVKLCGSTRPAYVLAATKDGKSTDLMYVYQPMGLSRQYDLQGSILARFQNLHVALSFLQVASTGLGIKYMDNACTVPMAEQEGNAEAQKAILSQWQTLKAAYDIEACEFSVKKELEHLPPLQSWSSMIDLLNVIAPSVCDTHKKWMYTQEEKNSL